MNNIAISNHLLVNLLQSQNVKRETVKKKEMKCQGIKRENEKESESEIKQEIKIDNTTVVETLESHPIGIGVLDSK